VKRQINMGRWPSG